MTYSRTVRVGSVNVSFYWITCLYPKDICQLRATVGAEGPEDEVFALLIENQDARYHVVRGLVRGLVQQVTISQSSTAAFAKTEMAETESVDRRTRGNGRISGLKPDLRI